MVIDVEAVVLYCAREVERQGDSALYVAHMYTAWETTMDIFKRPGGFDTLTQMDVMAIQKDVKDRHGFGYRVTPATFNQGKPALDAQHIQRQMSLLMLNKNDTWMNTDDFCHRFLEIHPFEDGNGRVASLLYNLRNGTLLTPVILPQYSFI